VPVIVLGTQEPGLLRPTALAPRTSWAPTEPLGAACGLSWRSTGSRNGVGYWLLAPRGIDGPRWHSLRARPGAGLGWRHGSERLLWPFAAIV
jgi:hypothetical protein